MKAEKHIIQIGEFYYDVKSTLNVSVSLNQDLDTHE